MRVTLKSYGATDVGLVRLSNEDVWAQMPKEKTFLLADGMGGHRAGEVAATETVLFLSKEIKKNAVRKPSPDEWAEILEKGLKDASHWVYTLASNDKDKEGMGTTVCVALFADHSLVCGHVGDSRIYRIRKGRITRLTRDHSLRDDLIEKGELDESLGQSFPYKNVITRAIGTRDTVIPDVQKHAVEEGDLYFLCSDGLTDPLGDEMLLATIEESETLKEATDELILRAKTGGGDDNVTIVMCKVVKLS